MKKQALLLLAAALLGLWPAPARAVSSYTQCLTLQQPATGDQTNSWGATVDTNWSIVDNAAAALETLNLPAQTGYPTVALSFSQGATDQAKYSRFSFTGALTAATTVLWPSGRCGRFVAQNGTTGAFGTTLCVNNGSGACAGGSVVVPQGQTEALYSDGTNIVPDTNAIGGGLTVNGNATVAGAATLSGGLSVAGTTTLGTPLGVPSGGSGAASLAAHGVLVGEGAGAVAATSPGTLGQVLTSNGPAADPTFQANAALTVLRDYIAGLILSNDGTSPNTTLDIAAGMATSDDAATYMTLSAAFTKTTGSWAAGSGNGALDTGSVAENTWYHVFEIERIDTQAVDILFSASATSPTLPPNYTKKRRIGSFKTAAASTNILGFLQVENAFFWQTPVLDVNSQLLTANTPASFSLGSVPTGIRVRPVITVLASLFGSSTGVDVYSPDLPDNFAAGFSKIGVEAASNGSSSLQAVGAISDVYTNTSGQIRAVSTGSSPTFSIQTFGWVDPRGQNL